VTARRRSGLDEVHRRQRRRRIQLPVVGAEQAVVTGRRRRGVVSPVMTSSVDRKQFVDELAETGSGADEVGVRADEQRSDVIAHSDVISHSVTSQRGGRACRRAAQ